MERPIQSLFGEAAGLRFTVNEDLQYAANSKNSAVKSALLEYLQTKAQSEILQRPDMMAGALKKLVAAVKRDIASQPTPQNTLSFLGDAEVLRDSHNPTLQYAYTSKKPNIKDKLLEWMQTKLQGEILHLPENSKGSFKRLETAVNAAKEISAGAR